VEYAHVCRFGKGACRKSWPLLIEEGVRDVGCPMSDGKRGPGTGMNHAPFTYPSASTICPFRTRIRFTRVQSCVQARVRSPARALSKSAADGRPGIRALARAFPEHARGYGPLASRPGPPRGGCASRRRYRRTQRARAGAAHCSPWRDSYNLVRWASDMSKTPSIREGSRSEK
jgi:hypothetical protein